MTPTMDPPEDRLDPDAASDALRSQARARARVLVAEDDPDLRSLATVALRAAGHDVVEAVSGAELRLVLCEASIAAWPHDPFDLVVTDVRLPGASGLEIVERLRRRGCGTPIVVVTAFPDPDVEQRCRSIDALLLSKPFPLRTLREATDLLLAARRGGMRRAGSQA